MGKNGTYVGTPCLRGRITDITRHVMTGERNLRPLLGQFDTVACSGLTGLLVAPALAEVLGCNLAVVRKEGDQHGHAPRSDVEGMLGESWIFVDDHISYGYTLTRTRSKILTAKRSCVYKGWYMYDDPYTDRPAWAIGNNQSSPRVPAHAYAPVDRTDARWWARAA